MDIILVGMGQVGIHLAKVLSKENHNIIAIEPNLDLCQELQESIDIRVLNGFGTDRRLLEEAGVEGADMVIAFTGSDENNILTCQLAAQYGVKQKIARVRNPFFFEKPGKYSLQDWGVDVVIQPELETAHEIVLLIKRSAATDVIEFADEKLQLIGIRLDATCPVLNKTLTEIGKENPDHLFRAVAILRNNRTIIPTGKDRLFQRDQVFFVTEATEIKSIISLFGKSDEKLQDIMILGGGKIGMLTAKLLEENRDLSIKLVEANPDKTLNLADSLRRTLVIEGDGRDLDLLAAEGILEMDALVSVTNDEETNILTCLLAKHLGVTKTIALVNRDEYMPIMAPIGLNAAVNSNIITSNAVLRLIRRGDVLSLASLPGVEAEIFEYRVKPEARITKKPLQKINFPKGAIIGGIVRRDTVLIPVGETIIQAGDYVVVFALPSAIKEVEKMFL